MLEERMKNRKGDAGLLKPIEPVFRWNTPSITSALQVFVQLAMSFLQELKKKHPMVFHRHPNVSAHQDACRSPTCSTKYSLHLPVSYPSVEGTP